MRIMRSHAVGVAAGLLLLGLVTVDGRQAGEPNVEPAVAAEIAVAAESTGRSPRNASYDIDVRLDHAARTLTGHETIQWRNITANSTSELQFHLYWNAWRNLESTWLRERQLRGNFTSPGTTPGARPSSRVSERARRQKRLATPLANGSTWPSSSDSSRRMTPMRRTEP